MPRFSPSDAALEGFRLTRERPLVVLVWAGMQLLFGVVSVVLQFQLGGAAFHHLLVIEAGVEKPSPEVLAQVIQQSLPSTLVIFLISLVFYSIMYAALLRAILRPADKALAYLRLSRDELRQLALSLILMALFTVYALLLSLLSGLLIALASGLGSGALPVQILIIFGLIAAFVYPAVRLSLAPAMTFVDGRITVFRSLAVTKGQFWSIAGSYGLALVLMVVVFLLAAVVFTFVSGAIVMAQHGVSALPDALQAMQPADFTLQGFLAPARIPNLIFGALLGTLAYLIMAGPAPVILRDLTGRIGTPTAPSAEPGKPWG
jgi:hypothetical protein